jgi:hypothetical protein
LISTKNEVADASKSNELEEGASTPSFVLL